MPTYQEYLYYATKQGFQPYSEATFKVLILSGFNPIKSEFQARSNHA